MYYVCSQPPGELVFVYGVAVNSVNSIVSYYKLFHVMKIIKPYLYAAADPDLLVVLLTLTMRSRLVTVESICAFDLFVILFIV